jgi:hypothetical protein
MHMYKGRCVLKICPHRNFRAKLFISLTLFLHSAIYCAEINEKVLICGVCKDIASSVPNTIKNIEKLGSKFTDYSVIIYENNSQDATNSLLSAWAKRSKKVVFLSETLSAHDLPSTREERIARARNIVLAKAKSLNSEEYKYLIMADLDFNGPWPIAEIVSSLKRKIKWDCISANGINKIFKNEKTSRLVYWDRYAFRNKRYPVGPEIVGASWWKDLQKEWFYLSKTHLVPVYSAFGGLAIYKTSTILRFSYS